MVGLSWATRGGASGALGELHGRLVNTVVTWESAQEEAPWSD